MRVIQIIFPLLIIIFNLSCEPFAKSYPSTSNPKMYEASEYVTPVSNSDQVKVVTWNIRFGAGRLPWIIDSCGEKALADYDSVEIIMQKIADSLNAMEADIVLLQEVDIESKRSGFMDQVQFLLDNTNLNYGAYASVMEVDFVFSDGLGRINTGNAILSKFKLTEAQRIKLASFLAKGKNAQPTLFIFDEPTTGLHFYDIEKLILAFNALIDLGHSIIVIEHNVEVIKCADHIIDLGPEGGQNGGHILFEGTPEELTKIKKNETSRFLKKLLVE